MAPKQKITPEMIVHAGFEVVRASGHEALNARSVAEKLGCSTQPILYYYKTMAEIRDAVYRMADDFHTGYIMKDAETAAEPFLSIGLAYIRFGQEESNLFRFLFQSDRFRGAELSAMLTDPALGPLLTLARGELGCGEEEIAEKFLVFFAAVHGYASLLANNALVYDEGQAARVLTMIFDGMKGS